MIGVNEGVNWAVGETVSSGKFSLDNFVLRKTERQTRYFGYDCSGVKVIELTHI
jgi:hypothetical protein